MTRRGLQLKSHDPTMEKGFAMIPNEIHTWHSKRISTFELDKPLVREKKQSNFLDHMVGKSCIWKERFSTSSQTVLTTSTFLSNRT